MELEINIKDNLRQYLPSIFLLLNENNIDWKNITIKYQKELNSRFLKLNDAKKNGKETIQIEACLFDIITRVAVSDISFFNLLKFFDDLFINLAAKTTEAEKKLLRTTIYNLLINTDTKYLNFIGELAVLNNLKNTGFELLQTEQPLTSSKESTKIDFTVKQNNKILLVEVYNIHLPEAINLDYNEIERRLIQKITDKLEKKQKKSDKIFYLVPVLWGEYEAIKLVNNYYIKSKREFNNTMYPSAYVSFNCKDGKKSIVKFGTIDKLILAENEC